MPASGAVLLQLLSFESVKWEMEIESPQPEGDLVAINTVGIEPGTYTIQAQVSEKGKGKECRCGLEMGPMYE